MYNHPNGLRLVIRAAIVLCLLLISGCAARNATEQDNDSAPTEPVKRDQRVNRGIYQFNTWADTWVLRPVARGYHWFFPPVIRTGINNFFENLGTPIDFLNAFLQGKFVQGFSDIGRFGMNTVFGLAGILDPATHAGLEKHNEDFGQTLGVWGIPEGPYIMVPFFGPRTVRSGIGSIADFFISPLYVIDDSTVRWGLFFGYTIHARSKLLGIDDDIRRAFDPYAFVRDAYLQNRRYLLYDGNPPEEDVFLEDEEFLDDEEFDDY